MAKKQSSPPISESEDDDEEEEDDDDEEDAEELEEGWTRDEDFDDGDGGTFSLPKGSELARAIARGKSASGSGSGGIVQKDIRQVKRLVLDVPEMDDIWKELAPRKKKKRRRNRGGRRRAQGKGGMPEDIAEILGEANMLLAFNNIPAAREKILEVIRQWPMSPDPYHTLGMIHEEEGEAGRALECFIIAAHLTAKDEELWSRLAEMSREQNNHQQVSRHSLASTRPREQAHAPLSPRSAELRTSLTVTRSWGYTRARTHTHICRRSIA